MIEGIIDFINWLESWRVALEEMKKDHVLENLSNLYLELAETSGDEGAEIDLDLLFLDILEAIGLRPADHLAAITGEAVARETLEKVTSPAAS